MKFLMAIVAYLIISFVLGWGILLAMKGNAWLLIVGFLAYAVAFAKLGCLPKSHSPPLAGRVTPCAPLESIVRELGAHRVTRPAFWRQVRQSVAVTKSSYRCT